MSGNGAESALKRIDAAIDRIERAMAQARQPASDQLERDQLDRDQLEGELRERHDRLREAVARSLRELDSVIAGRSR